MAVSIHSAPVTAPTTGGQALVYEIVVCNRAARDVSLQSLHVNAGAFGQSDFDARALASMSKAVPLADLAAAPDWLVARRAEKPAPPGVVPSGRTVAIYVWLEATSTAAPPQKVESALRLRDGEDDFEVVATASPRPRASRDEAVGFPFAPSKFGWVATNGTGNAASHRRTLLRMGGATFLAQRFAVDLVAVDSAGRSHDPQFATDNAAFAGYGTEVLAVATGKVRTVRDGLPENAPGVDSRALTIDETTVLGNGVVLEIEGERFVVYAHLQPGSIRVIEGQEIERGAVLGKLGSSGNSSAPHLHLHICDRLEILRCEGLPLVFDTFIVDEAELIEDESPSVNVRRLESSHLFTSALPPLGQILFPP